MNSKFSLPYTSLRQWRQETGKEMSGDQATGYNLEPQFQSIGSSGVTLKTTSPLIDAALVWQDVGIPNVILPNPINGVAATNNRDFNNTTLYTNTNGTLSPYNDAVMMWVLMRLPLWQT
ncbi:MAG: hypothetical protein IPL35_12135 [Sphingobacteriales bacterium]|nr:hypothetical protein [Sphingobacteriales bacterium]